MKVKRNKRVERNLQERTTRVTGKSRTTAVSLRGLRPSLFGGPGKTRRKSKSILALLEQDIAVQAQRIRRLEDAVAVSLQSPEPVLVEAEISESEEPESAPLPERTNYQYIAPSQRVRRRII